MTKITHTHPDIAAPYLRARMATALNELRHEFWYSGMWLRLDNPYHVRERAFNERKAFRVACEVMARLEADLDLAQAPAVDAWMEAHQQEVQ